MCQNNWTCLVSRLSFLPSSYPLSSSSSPQLPFLISLPSFPSFSLLPSPLSPSLFPPATLPSSPLPSATPELPSLPTVNYEEPSEQRRPKKTVSLHHSCDTGKRSLHVCVGSLSLQKVKKISKMLNSRKTQYPYESNSPNSLCIQVASLYCPPSLPCPPPSPLLASLLSSHPSPSLPSSLPSPSLPSSLSLPPSLLSSLPPPSFPSSLPLHLCVGPGVVELAILEGKNLVPKDSNGMLFNTTNVYDL